MDLIHAETLDAALAQVGLPCPSNVEIRAGSFCRFDDPEGKRGNLAAWCRPFPDGQGAVFGNWRTDQTFTWQKSHNRAMTKVEAQAFRQQVETARADALAAREAEYQDAAAKASQQWDAAVPATDAAYLVKKAIQPHGTRQQGQSLLVPVLDAQGAIQSLQTITPDGSKRFLSGGRMAGGRFWIGQPGPRVVVAEGFASGVAVHEATGLPVCCAFSAGNLMAVAQDVRRNHPDVQIILAADNDIKPTGPNVGRQKAQEAAKAVGGTVALPELSGAACDWWDARDQQGDAALVAVFNPPPRFRLLTGADVAAMPPIRWLVKGILPAQGLAQVYGASRSGKSFMVLDMACAIAEGRDWFGFRVKQAPVCYVALEGETGFKLRTDAWAKHHGRPLPDQFFMVLQPFQIVEQRDVLDLAQAIPQGALTIIDTQNRAAPAADENSSRDMGEILQGAKTIADITKGLVLLIAHTGKDDTKGVRGHSSQLAAMDAAIVVRRNGDARSWTLDKSKEGCDGDEHAFKLDVVELGTDADGDKLTSCVVAQAAAHMPRHRPMTDAQHRAVQAYIDACEAGHGRLDAEGKRFIGLHVEDWRTEFYRTSTADNRSTKQKAFARVRRDLVADAVATVADDVYRVITPDVTIKEIFFAGRAGQPGHSSFDSAPPMSGQVSGQKMTNSHQPDTAQCPDKTAGDPHITRVSA